MDDRGPTAAVIWAAVMSAGPLWRRASYHLPLFAPILLAAALRLHHLTDNGHGRAYYAAAVRSMLQSWHNVWFNAFDPAGFVSLDKPPVAIWLQALSAKLIGFSGWAVLLPQAIEGMLAVALVYWLVQRTFGRAAGLIAATLLALTPINIGVDRTNNTDSCLIVMLLLAAWAGIRAAETGRPWLVYLAAALVGLAFNVKMAAAWVFVPALIAAFVIGSAATITPSRLLRQLSIAGVILACVSLAWTILFDLTPADRRPYAGSTTANSMLELAVLHNGFARFRATANDPAPAQALPELWDTSPAGPSRLLMPFQAAQFAWWLPMSLAGLGLGFLLRSDGPTRDRDKRISLTLWGSWLALYWLVLSFAGGVFHTYYLCILGPPLAALAGIGVTHAWHYGLSTEWRARLPAAVIAAAAIWQVYLTLGQTDVRLQGALIWVLAASTGMALAASLFIAAGPWLRIRDNPVRSCLLLATACLALLAMPLAAGLSFLTGPQNPITPAARLANLQITHDDRAKRWTQAVAASREKLVGYLMAQRRGEQFLVAVPNALIAAPLIIATGAPVMAIGGYAGTDPILDVGRLQQRVASQNVRFVMLGGLALTSRQDTAQAAIEAWVRTAGRRVEPALWRLNPNSTATTYQMPVNGQWVTMPVPELFDMRPVPHTPAN